MALLIFYVLIALGFSFLCSILEATLLTITPAALGVAKSQGKKWAGSMEVLKADVEKPLAAILTLNTIAHTMGAAGAGAQWTSEFGSATQGIFAGVLTLAILIFTEIIPKTLGARYSMFFGRPTAMILPVMQTALAPLVWFSKQITKLITFGKAADAAPMHREELLAATHIGEREGAIAARESAVVRNILRLDDMLVSDIMTPRTVIFMLSDDMPLAEFAEEAADKPYSRVPVYGENRDDISGFVLKSEAVIAQMRSGNGNSDTPDVPSLIHPVDFIPATMTVDELFQTFIKRRSHLMLVTNEFGVTVGLVTLEDVLETIVGVEIIDETDEVADMQKLARDLWKKRAGEKGIELPEDSEALTGEPPPPAAESGNAQISKKS
jgi:CBS domain containing-hemolysin-like protein